LPFPYLGFDDGLNKILKCPIYPLILRSVRDRALLFKDIGKFWISSLFLEISDNYGHTSLEVLNEWIDSGDKELIKLVGLLINKADPKFLFNNSEFVSKLIERSYNVSDECYSSVLESLNSIRRNSFGSFIGKEPPIEDIHQMNHGEECAKKFQVGSPTHRFYISLYKSAKDL
jgi:hypothetical protein